MNELMYSFRESKVRVVMQGDEAWFVAKDVCEVLDIKNTTQAIGRLDDDERAMFNIGRHGTTNIINEFGLYALVMGSKKTEAKEFKRWVTHEVLPSIRKTGSYNAAQYSYMIDDPVKLAEKWIEEQKEKQLLSLRLEEQKPKVLLAE